ncbi:MAG: carboxylesterase family protein [Sphingomonas sp.]|nr:carboxylesterase family protein [Sphingomonas sp.]
MRTMLPLLWAAALAAPVTARPAPLGRAPAGMVRGTADGDLRVFKGLPYALPPTGARRWRPPVAPPAWKGVRDATRFGPACPQPLLPASSLYADSYPAMSEDCLSLNIWVPAHARRLPVLVWIHGGSLAIGAGSAGLFDGSELARRGLVVVTINYRLGVLGYLAHPELSAESSDRVSGNYGLLDQIAALRWVRRNIAAFGGDPGKVTIAGESAGGLSVLYLLASPRARGLFARAIAQSAYMISTPELRGSPFGETSAETAGAGLAADLGAGTIAAMRAMDATALTTAAARTGYRPSGTIDGRILPRQLVDTFDRGEQARVPVLAGFNAGEIRSLRFLMPPPTDPQAYAARIRASYGDLADAFLDLYPPQDTDDSMLRAVRDAMYGWTAIHIARQQSRFGARAWLYYFDHGYPAEDAAGLHAFHASELPFLFGTFDRTAPAWPRPPATPAEAQFGDTLASYWAAFAVSGAPAAPGAPAWKPYRSNESYMDFAEAPRLRTRLISAAYALADEVVCRRRAAGSAWNWNVGPALPLLPSAVRECR